jgi:hypothetical protein
MKKILTIILTVVLISLLVILAGAALSCKDLSIQRMPLSLTEDGTNAGHTLRSGSVTRVNLYGPNIYFTMSYKLRGAKPDTTYYICWWMEPVFPPLPEDFSVTVYVGETILTDSKGNGNAYYQFSREVVEQRVPGADTMTFKVLFIEGGLLMSDEEVGLPAGTLPPGVSLMVLTDGTNVFGNIVFETELFVTDFYWD